MVISNSSSATNGPDKPVTFLIIHEFLDDRGFDNNPLHSKWVLQLAIGMNGSNYFIRYARTDKDPISWTAWNELLISKSSIKTIVDDTLTKSKSNSGYSIVNMGDSITGNFKGESSISGQIQLITGANTYNCGFGGCQMAVHQSPAWSMFSMCSLADAIASGDFSLQEVGASAGTSGMPSYFSETVEILKSIDFSNVDLMTIAYGTNDYTAGKLLDNPSNKYDTSYYAGALRHSIETILTAYPNLRLVIVAPTWRYWMDSDNNYENDSDTRYFNSDQNVLHDFVDKCIEVGKEYHLPVVNPYDNLSINKFNYRQWFNTNDGTHPNEEGRRDLAKLICTTISGM